MSFPFKTVLLVGATAGIGKAMADRLVKEGVFVIAAGRRQERLDEFVNSHGKEKAASEQVDISEIKKMPDFAKKVIEKYPNLDCVFLNAGIQRPWDWSKPEKVDLDSFFEEMNVNYNSFVALTHAFLPFFLKQKESNGFIFTTSNLAYIPASFAPSYSVSKAALNAFTLCLRDQLTNTKTKVIELAPPAVQSELHDYMGEERGRKVGMPLDQFTEEAYKELCGGKDLISIGIVGIYGQENEAGRLLPKIISDKRTAFENLAETSRKAFAATFKN